MLTRFGLSPHPGLVLIVEGATELLMFPRVMTHFGLRLDEDYIAIHDREGITKDLNALLAYAIAPRTRLGSDGRYLDLARPLTRVLVVNDTEGPMATKAERETRRQNWIDRIIRTFPREHQTATVRQSIERLVHVDTWRRSLTSFEFAHFTNRELTEAIAAVRLDGRAPSIDDVARARVGNQNLKSLGACTQSDSSVSISPTRYGPRILHPFARRAAAGGAASMRRSMDSPCICRSPQRPSPSSRWAQPPASTCRRAWLCQLTSTPFVHRSATA
jgi:hypothetical protein